VAALIVAARVHTKILNRTDSCMFEVWYMHLLDG